jgi:hypothetical protein
MSKLQSYKRILSSDFNDEDRQLVDQLAGSINTVIDDHQYTLNGKVSLRDNIYCTVKDIEVTVDAAGGTGGTRVTVNNPQVQALGMQVIQVTNVSNSSIYPVGQPFITYSQLESSILLNNITGLLPGYRWRLRVIVWN